MSMTIWLKWNLGPKCPSCESWNIGLNAFLGFISSNLSIYITSFILKISFEGGNQYVGPKIFNAIHHPDLRPNHEAPNACCHCKWARALFDYVFECRKMFEVAKTFHSFLLFLDISLEYPNWTLLQFGRQKNFISDNFKQKPYFFSNGRVGMKIFHNKVLDVRQK